MTTPMTDDRQKILNDWLESPHIEATISSSLHGADDGEMYLQFSNSESLSLRDGQIKNTSYGVSSGFGLRAVQGEYSAYAYSNDFEKPSLDQAREAVAMAKRGSSGSWAVSPNRTDQALYTTANPSDVLDISAKVEILKRTDDYLRRKDHRVTQVAASVSTSWSVVAVVRPGGEHYVDVRPLLQYSISVIAKENGRSEAGQNGFGGRVSAQEMLEGDSWKACADRAYAQSLANLKSAPAPAGPMTVVLGSGWPGVMLHEAVGHGLEGDAIRKKRSVFAGRLGERVASPGVTVIDDGTMPDRRGSITIDDEGTPSQRNVLIEDGILVGFMQDRHNARLMGVEATGNGRRESFAHPPLPRMTNTFMENGKYSPDEIIESVEDGLYAVEFGGGQVDVTTGNFVFACTEAYRIRQGKVEESVKGASLIGNGPETMQQISMIGNDSALDRGIALCGKAGQSVPVGVGQPTLRMDNVTVGGTG